MKRYKKRAFTLIELVAVAAILGILIALLVPKITGYIKESKKAIVIDQARKARQAVETYEMLNEKEFKDKDVAGCTKNTIKAVLTFNETKKYLEGENLDKLKEDMTMDIVYEIVENRVDFTIDALGRFESTI
ncbi:pilin [Clostridium baratii]|uniref:type II secretion system protein n=1 Tax=Clostridium baratii TaxID=1561 RepID=UPI0006C223C4|nr:type II secretion system protein [Clostridium baratii]CUP66396.1 pilin [Clostridium baratii]